MSAAAQYCFSHSVAGNWRFQKAFNSKQTGMSQKLTRAHSDHKFKANICLDRELPYEDNILTILSNPLPELCNIFWMYKKWQLVSSWSRQSPGTPISIWRAWTWNSLIMEARERNIDTTILPQKTPLHTLGQAAASLDPSSPHLTYQKLNPTVEATKTDPSLSPLSRISPSSTTNNCW